MCPWHFNPFQVICGRSASKIHRGSQDTPQAGQGHQCVWVCVVVWSHAGVVQLGWVCCRIRSPSCTAPLAWPAGRLQHSADAVASQNLLILSSRSGLLTITTCARAHCHGTVPSPPSLLSTHTCCLLVEQQADGGGDAVMLGHDGWLWLLPPPSLSAVETTVETKTCESVSGVG